MVTLVERNHPPRHAREGRKKAPTASAARGLFFARCDINKATGGTVTGVCITSLGGPCLDARLRPSYVAAVNQMLPRSGPELCLIEAS
jgi:hypothetical protein